MLPSEASSYPGISYFESNDGNYACFHIENPALGDYTIWSSDSNDSLNVLRPNMPPFIELGNVSDNSSSKSLSVDWTDSDPDDNALISLGLDDDCQGGNGFVVVEEIEEKTLNVRHTCQVFRAFPLSYREIKYIYGCISTRSIVCRFVWVRLQGVHMVNSIKTGSRL